MNTNWSVQCTMYILEGKVGKNKSIIICVANTIGSFFLCYQWLWATYMQTRMNNMLNVKSTNWVHFACIMCWKWKKFIFHSQQMQRIALLINKKFRWYFSVYANGAYIDTFGCLFTIYSFQEIMKRLLLHHTISIILKLKLDFTSSWNNLFIQKMKFQQTIDHFWLVS